MLFDRIYVSDLARTRETFANVLMEYPQLGDTKTCFTPLLRERSSGPLEGERLGLWAEYAKKEGKDIREYKYEGGESWIEVNRRSSQFL